MIASYQSLSVDELPGMGWKLGSCNVLDHDSVERCVPRQRRRRWYALHAGSTSCDRRDESFYLVSYFVFQSCSVRLSDVYSFFSIFPACSALTKKHTHPDLSTRRPTSRTPKEQFNNLAGSTSFIPINQCAISALRPLIREACKPRAGFPPVNARAIRVGVYVDLVLRTLRDFSPSVPHEASPMRLRLIAVLLAIS